MKNKFTGELYGYARVSTVDQNLETQRNELLRVGVPAAHIIEEKKSGRTLNRKGLDDLIKRFLRPGDALVVWRLDRLGRNARDLLNIVEGLSERGIEFRSISEGLDTSTACGRMTLTILSAMAQFESDVNSERTKAGMERAKANGRMAGRKHYILAYPKRLARFTELWREGAIPDGWMSAAAAVAEMNKVDPDAPKIKSAATYSNWKAKGFPGFEKPKGK